MSESISEKLTVGGTGSIVRNGLVALVLPGWFQHKFGPTLLGRLSIGLSIVFYCSLAVTVLLVWVQPNWAYTAVTNDFALLAALVLISLFGLIVFITSASTLATISRGYYSKQIRFIFRPLLAIALVAQIWLLIVAFGGINAQRVLLDSLFGVEVKTESVVTPNTAPPQPSNENLGLEESEGRVNILLLGGDAGAGRWGLRPDSISVLSIDVLTGDTVIMGVPRNLEQSPFVEESPLYGPFPNGYDCGSSCLISYLYTYGEGHPELYAAPQYADASPGIQATRDAVEGVLGIDIPYVVLIDMAGFSSLVNSLGGVDVCVPAETLAQDMKTVFRAGCQHMNGEQALLYSRTRYDSNDYGRMQKQRAIQQAIFDQMNPLDLVMNFQSLARVGSQYISTNIPREALALLISLGVQAQGKPVTTFEIVPPTVDVTNPDFEWIQSEVNRLLAR